MYGLDPSIDLSFLVGSELVQVAVGLHEVILHLEQSITLTLHCDVQVVGSESGRRPATAAAPILLALLGAMVDDIAADTDGTLTLTWSDGSRLSTFDSSREFESYTVSHSSGVIVV